MKMHVIQGNNRIMISSNGNVKNQSIQVVVKKVACGFLVHMILNV